MNERTFVQRNITLSLVARRRSHDGQAEPLRKRDWSTSFKAPTELGFVDDCKETLMSILSTKRRTVEKAAHDIMKKDEDIKEVRGGSRQPNEEKLVLQDEIKCHIKSFRCREKHYVRANASVRSIRQIILMPEKCGRCFLMGMNDETKCKYSTHYCLFTARFN